MLGLYLAVPHRGTQRAEGGRTKHSHEARIDSRYAPDAADIFVSNFLTVSGPWIPAFRVDRCRRSRCQRDGNRTWLL